MRGIVRLGEGLAGSGLGAGFGLLILILAIGVYVGLRFASLKRQEAEEERLREQDRLEWERASRPAVLTRKNEPVDDHE